MIMKKFECKCNGCSKFKYSNKYDAMYCSFRNEWLEKRCTDKSCEYCKDRPPYPRKRKITTKREINDFNKRLKGVNKKKPKERN